jgi:hypothetical protein
MKLLFSAEAERSGELGMSQVVLKQEHRRSAEFGLAEKRNA